MGKIVPDSQRLRPLSQGARACGARLIYDVVWTMRFAHGPHHIINRLRGEAARVSDRDGNQIHS